MDIKVSDIQRGKIMVQKFAELETKMSPEARARVERKVQEALAEMELPTTIDYADTLKIERTEFNQYRPSRYTD
jgi:hypothetical protein